MRSKSIHTTISNKVMLCPLNLVNRQFRANRPNAPATNALSVDLHIGDIDR